MRHKWNINNICEKCGVERKWTRPTISMGVFGKPIWLFNVNDEWIAKTPECKK